MRNRKLHLTLMITVACQLDAHANAENWPQWRGPTLNGVSSDLNLPVTWTKTENVVWRLPLPAFSGSTPIVWQDRIFLNIADQKNLLLWAVDRNTGRPVWQKHLSGGNQQATEAKHVVALTGDRRPQRLDDHRNGHAQSVRF
jgi:outer membrane protein assembly factor BamB